MDIRFFSPSYKRPIRSSTQELYPCVKLVVMESEAQMYRAYKNEIVTCPDEIQGNLCRVRNWILDQNKDADCVVLVDDDSQGVFRYQGGKAKKLDDEELQEFVEMACIMAEDSGVKFWGINCVCDKGGYREYTPLSFVKYIAGPFQAHFRSELRYDENLPLKEDYDLTLQHLNQHRRVLRFNMYHIRVKQAEQIGGCAAYRNTEREKEQFASLQRKWGSKIIQEDKQSKREFDFNPICKPPIRGV